MARLARLTIPGYPHLVTQRGNYDQLVFEENEDYKRYLGWLTIYAKRYLLEVWAYCLMPNHVHYVCVPQNGDALARTFNTLHMKYAQYFHRKKGLNGHLWRSRFLSCVLDEASAYEEARFIETNPVRAGLIKRPEDYPWSSARSHVLRADDIILSNQNSLGTKIRNWEIYLDDNINTDILNLVHSCLRTGRPAGDIRFVRKLEMLTGRALCARPRGRPRKGV